MTRTSTTATALPPSAISPVGKALEEVSASFDRFCLAAGIEALGAMMERDAATACGARHVACRIAPRVSLGLHAGQDWLPRRQDARSNGHGCVILMGGS